MPAVSIEEKKAFLSQGLEIAAELQTLRDTRQRVYDDATSITGRGIQDYRTGKREVHKFDRLVILDDFITEREKELVKHRESILRVIYTLEESPHRQVLVYKYIHGMTAEKIAETLNYCEGSIYRLQREAIKLISITPAMIKTKKVYGSSKH